jgi:hypothetical protein
MHSDHYGKENVKWALSLDMDEEILPYNVYIYIYIYHWIILPFSMKAIHLFIIFNISSCIQAVILIKSCIYLCLSSGLPFGCLINRIRLSFKIKYMSN